MSESAEEHHQISRRTILKWAAGGAAAIGAAIGGKILLDQEDQGQEHPTGPTTTATGEISTLPSKILELNGRRIKAEFGKAEKPSISGLEFYPDGHMSFIKRPDGVKIWLAGGPKGYIVESPDVKTLGGRAREVIGPGGQDSFDRDYAAPGSVISGNNPDELLMFYHGEYHPKAPNHFPFNAGIGVATSHDQGNTWTKHGQIFKGLGEKTADTKVYGTGQPSAIIKDDHIYLYYTDWNDEFPDSIHVARSPISSNGMPDTWEKYHEGQFKKGEESTPVIHADKGNYAATPSISWNNFLDSYVASYESLHGFEIATSQDGISWSPPQRLMDAKTINDSPKPGELWNSYPTLWSPNEESDQTTNNDLLLLYGSGPYQGTPHTLSLQPVTLSRT